MKTPIANPKILIIDDEADIRHLLAMSLVQMDIEVDCAKDIAEAMKYLQTNSYHFCITDMKLPDGNGLSIVEYCNKELPHMPIAVITAFGNTDTAVNAMKLGAFDFLAKPIELVQLRQLLQNAFNYNLETSNSEQRLPIDFLNGDSQIICQFRSQLEKVHKSNAPIIIQGAKGTQKEKVAKYVHTQSSRGEYQEVYLDCSTIDSEKVGPLLFSSKENNILIQAHKSSLIISNIQLLSKSTQKQLLQVLESKALYIRETNEERIIDVRVIVCTDKDLEKYVTSLELREDLFFRLNVLTLKIPNLEQRREDMGFLIDLYLEKIAPDKSLSTKARKKLTQYKYPFNYRELNNLISKANNLSESDVIEINDLLFDDSESMANATQHKSSSSIISSRGHMPLDDYISAIEKQEIKTALEQTRWNRTEAAKLLGISFRTIRYKIKKLGIE